MLTGGGLLVLAPGRWPADPETVARHLLELPAVTVLVADPAVVPASAAPVVAAADVCLSTTPEVAAPWVAAGLDTVERPVTEHPLAAYALVSLTRISHRLGTVEAICAESATYAALLGSRDHHKWLAARPPRRPRPEPADPVLVDLREDTIGITLNRPHVRNAVDRTLRDGLVAALEVAETMPAMRVELRGSGACFSAGGDLDEFGEVDDPATAHAVRATRHPALALARLADRTTAHVHGHCVGAGVELAAMAGRVIADPGTTFRLPEIAMGLIPGAGGTCSLVRRTGRQRADWLMLAGAVFDASAALGWHLVDEVAAVPHSDLDTRS